MFLNLCVDDIILMTSLIVFNINNSSRTQDIVGPATKSESEKDA